MKVVCDERWSWVLHQDGERLFLTVMCGLVGIYDVNFELTPDEIGLYTGSNLASIGRLVDSVRRKPENFMSRNIKGFLGLSGVVAAGKEWKIVPSSPNQALGLIEACQRAVADGIVN